jgi:hypothetical protein
MGGPLSGGSFCTVAAVGRDALGNLVAMTAGHCYTLIPGDSGGGVVLKGGFAGVNSAINPSHGNGPFQFTNIAGILSDLNKQGSNTVGIGFQPLHDGDPAMN